MNKDRLYLESTRDCLERIAEYTAMGTGAEELHHRRSEQQFGVAVPAEQARQHQQPGAPPHPHSAFQAELSLHGPQGFPPRRVALLNANNQDGTVPLFRRDVRRLSRPGWQGSP